MTIGIYEIKNTSNNKTYIGQSVNIDKRWAVHLYYLRKGSHSNNHLQSAWNKYGESSFKFSIIEECITEALDDREIQWIKQRMTNNSNYGYNLTSGGNSLRGELNPFYGKTHTQRTKDLLSSLHTGKTITVESIQKQRETKGDKYQGENSSSNILTESQVIKVIDMLLNSIPMIDISNELNINYNIIKSIKQKRNWKHLTKDLVFPSIKKDNSGKNNPMYGKTQTDETKSKISKKATGRKLTEEHKATLRERSNPKKGSMCYNAVVSEDTVLKIIDMLSNNFRNKDISEELGVKTAIITQIRNGYTWKHLTSGLTFPKSDRYAKKVS